MPKLPISLVSYINTRPFLDGLERFLSPTEIELHLLPPSACAQHFQEGKSALSLLPVGALGDLQQVNLLPEYCIGAEGKVDSVFLFSQQPIEKIQRVVLDSHSRSSNLLTQVLLRHHWKKSVEILPSQRGHFDLIKGTTAGVVIGDRAIYLRDQYAYVYDLAEEWQQMTLLPFVFAVWAYDPQRVAPALLDRVREALGWGVAHAAQSAEKWAEHYHMPLDYARQYLTEYISYTFDADKHRALEVFWNLKEGTPATLALRRNKYLGMNS